MKYLLLTIISSLLFITSAQQCPSNYQLVCNQIRHTATYDQFYSTFRNQNNRFYDKRTFGIDLINSEDPCAIMTRPKFIKLLTKRNIYCTGMYCMQDSCDRSVYSEWGCYEMEHIFDKSGPDFADTPLVKETLANVIMVYWRWNREISHTRIGYLSALNEKSIMYRQVEIDEIRTQLYRCQQKLYPNLNQSNATTPVPRPGPRPRPNTSPIMLINDTDPYSGVTGFDYDTDCDISCTCDSNKYLDILCDCDYSETGFNISDCHVAEPLSTPNIPSPIANVPNCTNHHTTEKSADVTAYVVTIVILGLVVIGLVGGLIYVSRDRLQPLYSPVNII